MIGNDFTRNLWTYLAGEVEAAQEVKGAVEEGVEEEEGTEVC